MEKDAEYSFSSSDTKNKTSHVVITMADLNERSVCFQYELTPQLSSEAVVSVPTSEEFHHSNLRFTQYERPVS